MLENWNWKKWLKISLLFLLSFYILNYLGLIVHEIGGHALTQKLVGGSVAEVSIANVKLFEFTKGGTTWKFGIFPLRGYVLCFSDARIFKSFPIFWKDIIVSFMGYPVEMIFFWWLYKQIKKKEPDIPPDYFFWGKSVFRWALIFLMIITSIWNCPFLRFNDFTSIAENLIYGKETYSLYLFNF
ncbi:MAG: site-2 protease family protein [Candidatus Moeniiplasma glomeromycotorum]|nr:site-2 protease family protein [Candidatus Moeniiplasma glomeromycotorum]MCE8162515.1 site-2 protease family protein [Candidatus Moeniiplasma glomeromycotorum]MCE8166442.1 site-2 protease family protein [Candidatus Moeniiplasma glomeromycotorum]MCE8166927.1 site-2 protease family protein [Candidatus Moeniiplasma glomeromycotorum]